MRESTKPAIIPHKKPRIWQRHVVPALVPVAPEAVVRRVTDKKEHDGGTRR